MRPRIENFSSAEINIARIVDDVFSKGINSHKRGIWFDMEFPLINGCGGENKLMKWDFDRNLLVFGKLTAWKIFGAIV